MKHKHTLSPVLRKRLNVSTFLFYLFLVFGIIAILGPKWGADFVVSEYRRGLDVVFAIDVSRSMDIRDAPAEGVFEQINAYQSRLERGITIAKEAASAAAGARLAAAIGRGKGYLTVPLTWDNETVLHFLEVLDGSSMTGRSTNLEALIDAAADAFNDSSPARKVIVLISDGESLNGVIRNALNRCFNEGIIVTAVAIGSDTGRIVLADESEAASQQAASQAAGTGAQTGGIISQRDTAVMRMAADRTGGIYIDGNRDSAAYTLSNHLLSLSVDTRVSNSNPILKERRTLFIILAIIAFGFSKLIPLLPIRGKRHLPVVAMLFLLFFSSCSEGKLLILEANYLQSRGRYDEALIPYLKALEHKDAAPYAEYGLGLTYFLIDENSAALKRYDSSQKILETMPSTEHRELRYRNSYNSGIVYFEEGNFKSAAEAFKDALKADPRRIEAKRNLELSLMSVVRQTQEDNSGGSPEENEMKEILFEYIEQEEQQKWKSMEWAPEEKPIGPDY
jgi:Ca-activated chloride channel family protein